MFWGSGGIAPRILNLGTRWTWSASCPGRFTPRERTPSAHWIGGGVGPNAGLDAVAKRKNPNPYRESNPACSACNLVTTLTELPRLLYSHCAKHRYRVGHIFGPSPFSLPIFLRTMFTTMSSAAIRNGVLSQFPVASCEKVNRAGRHGDDDAPATCCSTPLEIATRGGDGTRGEAQEPSPVLCTKGTLKRSCIIPGLHGGE
jgi:hypothetical protein